MTEAQQRQRFCEDSKGKIIAAVEYDDTDDAIGPYYVITFEDGSELSVRLVRDVVGEHLARHEKLIRRPVL